MSEDSAQSNLQLRKNCQKNSLPIDSLCRRYRLLPVKVFVGYLIFHTTLNPYRKHLPEFRSSLWKRNFVPQCSVPGRNEDGIDWQSKHVGGVNEGGVSGEGYCSAKKSWKLPTGKSGDLELFVFRSNVFPKRRPRKSDNVYAMLDE